MYFKKNFLLIIIIALLLLMSSFFLFVDAEKLISFILYIIAIFMIIIAINFLISSKEYIGRDKRILIAQSILLITISILTFVFPGEIMRTILGFILIIVPLVKIIMSVNKKELFLREIYKFILGIFLILSFDSLVNITIKAFGILLLIIAIVLIIILFKNRHQNTNVLYKILVNLLLRKG